MKIKRNDPCPCGSGKKYKQCCMNSEGEPLPNREDLQRAAYQALGFRPRIIRSFYAEEMVHFYLETIRGLKEVERERLTDSLKTFVEYMETIRVDGWRACDQTFWEKLFAFSYLDLSYEQTTEKTKAFFQTMIQWVNWLSGRQKLDETISGHVVESASTTEDPVLEAVQFLDAYQQKIDQPFLSGYGDVKRQALLEEEGDAPLTEGLFVVKKQTDIGCLCESLLNSQNFEVRVPTDLRSSIHPDMSFVGVLKQKSTGEWEILVLDRVFPAVALPYLKQQV